MKLDSPLAKLLKSVLSFKKLSATAEFVSNTRYKVELEAGGTAVSMEYVGLEELTKSRQTHIGETVAKAYGMNAADIPLGKVGLRYAPIEVNDMRVHVIGAAHGFLKQISVAHAAQADSFVDALFAKLATASRNTSKCKTWDELIRKRGYSRKHFDEALGALHLLPDQQKRREEVLDKLSQDLNWHTREKMRVEVALTDLARLKVIGGETGHPGIDSAMLDAISAQADSDGWSEIQEFQALEEFLSQELSDETSSRVKAISIYTMVEAWTNLT